MNNICSEETCNKSFTSQWGRIWGGLPMWGFPKDDRNILQRFMNFSARSWIVILLQVKTIWSMMGIIIELLIKTRSYRYWMRLSRRSYGCVTETSYDKILCSQDIWYRILILKCICKYYQEGRIFHVGISKAQQEDYTAVILMGCIKWNSNDVAS